MDRVGNVHIAPWRADRRKETSCARLTPTECYGGGLRPFRFGAGRGGQRTLVFIRWLTDSEGLRDRNEVEISYAHFWEEFNGR
jgi:hypothetical protein